MSKLKLLDDKNGAIGWLLSQIGLLLAAGVLIGAIAGLTFYSDWQKEAEAQATASEIATAIETMDLKSEGNSTKYLCPYKNYQYSVNISTEFVTVSRAQGGTFTNNIRGVESLLIKPFIRSDQLELEWNTSGELHDYLETRYGDGSSSGAYDTPFPHERKEDIKEYLSDELNQTAAALARRPLHLGHRDEPLMLEKAFIYFEDREGGLETLSLVIVHKLEENV